ncbi:hypothetical protein ACH5RR_021409 [Cinchona calisaya]|uniref:Uncharacterized protein n=1 Tax=Cinchona calisaya TaxID=153742 RepID=A0ABD2ZKQ9_9GENT
MNFRAAAFRGQISRKIHILLFSLAGELAQGSEKNMTLIDSTISGPKSKPTFLMKNEIAKAVEDELEKVTIFEENYMFMCYIGYVTYGYEIVQTLIIDIEPDEYVKCSMYEINAGRICLSDDR